MNRWHSDNEARQEAVDTVSAEVSEDFARNISLREVKMGKWMQSFERGWKNYTDNDVSWDEHLEHVSFEGLHPEVLQVQGRFMSKLEIHVDTCLDQICEWAQDNNSSEQAFQELRQQWKDDPLLRKTYTENLRDRVAEIELHPGLCKLTIDYIKAFEREGFDVLAHPNLLHWSTNQYYGEVTEFLLDKGISVDARDEFGNTPLHTAFSEGSSYGTIHSSILLDKGADPNVKNQDGKTPLHFVAQIEWNDPDRARSLIEAGADVNARDSQGKTSLHDAISTIAKTQRYDYREGAFAELLRQKADPRIADNDGNKPSDYLKGGVFDYVAQHREARATLISKEQELSLRDRAGIGRGRQREHEMSL